MCEFASLRTKFLRGSKQKKNGNSASVSPPKVMRECSLSPSRISICIHGLSSGHSTYRRSCDTLTSYGCDVYSCVMLRICLRSGSCIQILLLLQSAMKRRPMGSVVS